MFYSVSETNLEEYSNQRKHPTNKENMFNWQILRTVLIAFFNGQNPKKHLYLCQIFKQKLSYNFENPLFEFNLLQGSAFSCCKYAQADLYEVMYMKSVLYIKRYTYILDQYWK